MPDYSIWYSETYTNKGYFTANSRQEAIELLTKVDMGDMLMDELPNFAFKDKGYELELEPKTVKEN
jgi:hypothetical protein